MGELSDYLAGLDESDRAVLDAIRQRAVELVPDAVEGVSYGMGALRYRGRPLLSLRVAARHLALYPFSPEVVAAVAAEVGPAATSKGTIRFSAAEPLAPEVIDRVITLRRAEIDAAEDGRDGS